MPAADPFFSLFLRLSALLSGFNRVELMGTGMAQRYYTLMMQITGEAAMGQLLTLGEQALQLKEGKAQKRFIETRLFVDAQAGPLARNLITLWYLGLWNQLPMDWRNRYGAHALDSTHYPSSEAYAQGLVWQAMHSHPQGTHQPGFGSWALPPVQEAQHGQG